MLEELNRLNNNCEPAEELGPCKGVSLPTDCVIEDNLIGEFDGGTQHEFNEFILKELKEEIRRLEGLATIEGPAGEDGREIKLGSEIIDGDSWIVWRYESEAAWKKLKKQSELKGTDGREVHLSVEVLNGEEWIVWNYVGENHTFPLINKEQLIGEKGIDGTDGREIELTVEDYFIKWRYVGTDTWEDLISIEALRGPRGLPGVPGIQGIPGEPGEQGEPGEPGREVEIDTKIYNGAEWIVWRYEGDPQWNPLIEKESLKGDDGQDGVSGREVELRSNGVYIQWRYNGELETDWRNLVPIFNLRGPAGDDGVDGTDGRETELGKQLHNDEVWIVWRYAGDTEWIPLVKVSELQGEDGDEVELRVLDGYIQWKYEDQDASSWVNLISLEEIRGDHPILRVKNGWVQWKLSNSPEYEWADLYEIPESDGGGGGGFGGEHNELEGLQGGIPELNEYYHLSGEQHQQLAQLLYEEHTMNLVVNPAYGEKGVATDVTFDFTINPKQDQIISVTDNYSNSYDTITDTVTIQDVVSTISRTFTVQYDKYGEILNKNYTKVYNAYVPQWRGRHTKAEMNSYLDLSTYLGKVVQASTTIENIVMPTNQYIWFASNKSDAKIYDQNEFQQTIGTWGDGVSEFYTKPLTITLQDGTTATTYLYRTRLTKTIPSTFKYTIR